MTKENIVALGKAICTRGNKPVSAMYEFEGNMCEYSSLNATFSDELKKLGGDYNSFRRNKLDIYEIIQTTVDEVLPIRILDAYAEWAEIKQVPQGQKARFAMKTGTQRAKKFITRVGLAGVYEVFKLDKEFFEVETTAYGGAAQIGIEEMLDGTLDFAELTEIIMQGLDDAVMKEIANAMAKLENVLPSINVETYSGFDEKAMDRLIATSRAYGTPVIYTTLQFASQMMGSNTWWASEKAKDEYIAQGYVGRYKGVQVVLLPQSFDPWDTDSDINKTFTFDPQYAYVIPAGSNGEKPVSIVIEGNTLVADRDNYDWSKDIHVYKKFGVALRTSNDICIYKNTSISKTNTKVHTI